MPLHERDANAAQFGGVILEDVMSRIWEIDRFPLVFTDMLMKDTSGNHYKEFTVDELGAQDLTNAAYDGQNITENKAQVGNRQGSYHQTITKPIKVSTRANAVASIGRQASLSYQVRQAQKRLRRDAEGIMLANQGSAVGDPDSQVPSKLASLDSWIKTNVDAGSGSSAGGFNFTTGLVEQFTHGGASKRALTETGIRDIIQAVYIQGGDPSELMMVPAVKRKFSEYLFTTGRIATQYNPNQSTSGSTAYGTHDVFAADFAVVRLRDNRLQPDHAAGESTAYVLDPKYLRQSFLTGYRVDPLAKQGLWEYRVVHADMCLLVTNEKSQGMYTDVDNTLDVTFS